MVMIASYLRDVFVQKGNEKVAQKQPAWTMLLFSPIKMLQNCEDEDDEKKCLIEAVSLNAAKRLGFFGTVSGFLTVITMIGLFS